MYYYNVHWTDSAHQGTAHCNWITNFRVCAVVNTCTSHLIQLYNTLDSPVSHT